MSYVCKQSNNLSICFKIWTCLAIYYQFHRSDVYSCGATHVTLPRNVKKTGGLPQREWCLELCTISTSEWCFASFYTYSVEHHSILSRLSPQSIKKDTFNRVAGYFKGQTMHVRWVRRILYFWSTVPQRGPLLEFLELASSVATWGVTPKRSHSHLTFTPAIHCWGPTAIWYFKLSIKSVRLYY